MGFFDNIGGFLDSAGGFLEDVGSFKDTLDSFSGTSEGAPNSFGGFFPPIFQPPAHNAPTAPPPTVAAAPGGFSLGGSAVPLMIGAIALVVVLKR